ncbi:hypothetical protein D3C85_740670 [compost metagenome]
MPNQYRLLYAQRVHEADHIADGMDYAKAFHVLWHIGFTVSTHVQGDGSVAVAHQRWNLVPPAVPEFWEAVAQDHCGAFPGFDVVDLAAVDFNVMVA